MNLKGVRSSRFVKLITSTGPNETIPLQEQDEKLLIKKMQAELEIERQGQIDRIKNQTKKYQRLLKKYGMCAQETRVSSLKESGASSEYLNPEINKVERLFQLQRIHRRNQSEFTKLSANLSTLSAKKRQQLLSDESNHVLQSDIRLIQKEFRSTMKNFDES